MPASLARWASFMCDLSERTAAPETPSVRSRISLRRAHPQAWTSRADLESERGVGLQTPSRQLHHLIVPITSTDRSAIEQLLRRHFRRKAGLVDVFRVNAGANGATHFVALADDGSRYGLKAAVRVAAGTEKECALSQFATILAAPNARSMVHVPAGTLSWLASGFALVPWLDRSGPLNAKDKIAAETISMAWRRFAVQFGEWMTFGLLFGMTDLHEGNWVWAPRSRRLAMVDFEGGFSSGTIAEYRWFTTYVPWLDGDPVDVLAAVETGIARMHAKFLAQRPRIEHNLDHSSSAPGYRSACHNMTAADLVLTFRSL